MSVLLNFLRAKAYELLWSIITPEKPASKNYDQLMIAMKTNLYPKPLKIVKRFKFHQQSHKEGETIAQYLAKLRKLTQHCDFEDKLDETLTDRLVCGMLSGQIQKRLLV